jgi:1-acyl-sn-glycerol-3-phosphate acyltransferase
MTMLYRLLIVLGRPLARLLFHLRVEGREHVPAGGVVVCPNHVSGFDALAVAFALAPRRTSSMAKNELFRRPVLGRLVRRLGAFPARYEDGAAGGIAAAAALAAGGGAVVIFPEGARRRGRPRTPRTGAARAALAAGVPLVPAAVRGTDGWRERRRWRIAFGEPVDLDDLRQRDAHDNAREATRRLWRSVARLEATLAE